MLPERLPRACSAAAALISIAAPPVAAQYTLYYGNMHSHCSLSDDASGSGSPSTAFAYARDTAGIDVLALTDHSHYMSASEYNTLKSAADTYTQNGVFIAVAAQEHGSLSSSVSGAFGHINVYEYVSVIDQSTYRYDLHGTYGFIVSNVDRITGAPLVGAWNHPYNGAGQGPNAQFEHFAYDSTGNEAIELVEVINGKRSSSYETEYFDALSNGWRIGAVGNQDNHQGSWGDQPNNAGNIPLTGIWAVGLTKADILDALKARRTVAMEVQPANDRISLEFTADGNWMGSEYTTGADSIEFFVDVSAATNISSIALFRNGALIRSTGAAATSVQWTVYDTPAAGNFYYLVRVSQADGDRAWSSPVWIESTSSTVTPISTINQDDGSGNPTLWFQTRTVQGVVTVPTDTLNTTGNELFIQDATGGLMVLEQSGQTTPVVAGDNILVTGFVDTFQGQTMMSGSPPTITIQGSGGADPPPIVLTTNELEVNGETYEGSVIELRNVSVTAGSWPSPGFDGSVTIDDGSGPATMLIDKDTSVDDLGAPPDSVFTVRGIATQRDISQPYTCCWVVLPRTAAELFVPTPNGVIELPLHEDVDRTVLHPSSPNPFRPQTTIRFDIAGAGSRPVLVAVHDVTGRLVRTLVNEPLYAGTFEVSWDGRSDRGERTAAGVYFVRLVTPETATSHKVVRLN